ncbi:MAG: hypothetical protein HY669_02350 [Chloroflexi bacterium]|nr:hypothetical protein [Chloroflexota bacterium]
MDNIDPEVAAFVRFCVHRRGNCWPDLYDEMCRVASNKLYKGLGYTELRRLGVSLSLDNLDKTARTIDMAVETSLPQA